MVERWAKQRSQGTEMATIDVATKKCDVLDNYNQVLQLVEAETDEEVEVVEVYAKTQDIVLKAFVGLNLTREVTLGEEFDYEEHKALMQMPSKDYKEGIVCQDMVQGWKCGEKCIRPAMVAVVL